MDNENKSLVDLAYEVRTNLDAKEGKDFKPVSFGELLRKVGNLRGITDENELIARASHFYTELTLDGRFVVRENNTWSLREHEKYADAHIDRNDAYSYDEYEEDEDEEKKEKDYDSESTLDSDEEENEDEEGNGKQINSDDQYEDEDENN